MQICIYKRMIKIYCISSYFNFVFHQRRDQQEAFFGVSSRKRLNQRIVVNGLY